MSELISIIVLSLFAGAAMPAGAFLARLDISKPAVLGDEGRHFIVAFGGGALISAVALVLVPHGASKLSVFSAGICFTAGGLFFYALNKFLSKLKSASGQLVAMLSDFVPEAIALGAAFAAGEGTGVLLALLMVIQNLPEGFNAYEELSVGSKISPNIIIASFCILALAGPAAALTGYYFLGEHEQAMAALMLFASAGILYLVFEDIAPNVKLESKGMPALGAVAGFLVGLIGSMLLIS